MPLKNFSSSDGGSFTRAQVLLQNFTDLHGCETPDAPGQPTLAEAGLVRQVGAALDGEASTVSALHIA